MKTESREVKPAMLGAVGEAHIRRFLLEQHNVDDPDVIDYRKVEGEAEGLPFILEVAFGMYGPKHRGESKAEIIGVNWTPALSVPFDDLPELLGAARVDDHDPVVIVVHLAYPRPPFTDRGKSRMALPNEICAALEKCVGLVTKKWMKLKRQADKNNRLNERQLEEYQESKKQRTLSVKEAAYQVMARAYMQASAGGTLPANARQVMYAARPLIIELTGKSKPWASSSYFTQRLLPDYVKENPEETAEWDVVFDARGHFSEPHTGTTIGLGTLQVRKYVDEWEQGKRADVEEDLERVFKTSGSTNRYGAVMFVEKEGFNELWHAVNLSERYDLAIMSTKGMSVTASRYLIEELSALELPIFVLRDFDKPGFSILHTLCNDTRRYQFSKKPKVVD